MSRPEDTLYFPSSPARYPSTDLMLTISSPPDLHYNDTEAKKYTQKYISPISIVGYLR